MKLISIRALLSASALSLSLTAFADPPPTPNNVLGAYIGNANYVRLTWEVTPGADAYNIYVYDASNQVWQTVELGFTNTNVALTNVIWRQYNYGPMPATYSVTATNAEGESAASPAVTVNNDNIGNGATIVLPFYGTSSLTPTNALIYFMNNSFPGGGDGMLEIGTDETNMTVVGFDSFYAEGHGWWASNLVPATLYTVIATTVDTNRYGRTDISWFNTPDTNHPPVGESRDFEWNWWVPDPETVELILFFTDNEMNSGSLYTIRIVTQPTNGTASINPLQTYGSVTYLTYTPNPGARGEDHIDWVVNDGQWDSAPATLRIFNLRLNRLPAVQQMYTNTPEDVPLTIGVSAPDADGDPVTFECIGADHGIAELDETGTNVIYTPFADWFGEDMIAMWAHDGYGDTNFQIMVTVTSVNDPPQTEGYELVTFEDCPIETWPPITDGEGGVFTFRAVEGPSHGTVTGGEWHLIYTPETNYFGPDSFKFVLNDGIDDSAPATMTVVVLPANDSPVAFPTNTVIMEDVSTNIHVTTFDTDGDSLAFYIANPPAHGTVTNDGPDFFYTPEPNYNGEDSFSYYVADLWDISQPADVNITITAVNDAPSAGSTNVVVAEDSQVLITLSASDVEGNLQGGEYVTSPSHGTLSGTFMNPLYTPSTNYNGPDSFTFRVFDGELYSAAATVNITVTPVNDPPLTNVTTAEETSVSFHLIAYDNSGHELNHFALRGGIEHGTLTGQAPDLTYTPNTNFSGSDYLEYDAWGDPAIAAYRRILTITVTPVNDAPQAISASLTTGEDSSTNIVLSGSDVDNDPLTYEIVSGPSHGTLTGTAPNVVYTPALNYNGSDSITFRVFDGAVYGASAATVAITVAAVNDPPQAEPANISTTEDASANITLTGSDVEGASLTFEVVDAPSHGALTGTSPNLVYTPAANYDGNDSFTFRAFDGQVYGAAAQVTITITPVNDAPQATANSITTEEDTSGNVTLSGTDVEGSALTFEVVTGPGHGTLTGTLPNLVYTPNANYNGSDAFAFRAFDGQAYSAAAQVTITVNAVNDAPVATPQSISTPYNTSVAITLAGSDVEGSSLSYTVLTQPASGSLTGTAPNLTFTPAIGSSGSVNFSFRVNDGALNSASASVSITVQAATAVPTAPSGLTATAVSTSQINLAWTDNSNNEDGFAVFRSTDNQHWTQIGAVGPNVTTYSSTGLSNNKTYYYYVRAWNMIGNSGNSNTASAKTLK